MLVMLQKNVGNDVTFSKILDTHRKMLHLGLFLYRWRIFLHQNFEILMDYRRNCWRQMLHTLIKTNTYESFLYLDRTRKNHPLKCIWRLRRVLMVWPTTTVYSLALRLVQLSFLSPCELGSWVCDIFHLIVQLFF
jgi:hypothetical protein